METRQRKQLSRYRGVVASKSGDQTIKVVVDYQTTHPKYGKRIRRRTVAHVHDADNQASKGDVVEICKCRPMSKTKNWRLLNIIEKSSEE